MLTIYINSFDLRRIIKTIKEKPAFSGGYLFKAISNPARINNEYFVATLDLIEMREMVCRVVLRGRGCFVAKSVDVPLRDLEFLLNNRYGEEIDNTRITVKVDNFDVNIEMSDVIEYEEPCPHCGKIHTGYTDSSLVTTCPYCGKEIMVCSMCPTHCGESDKKICYSCIFYGMDCSFACNGNTGEGCHMKLRVKNIKTF